jgi:hypothetical protein
MEYWVVETLRSTTFGSMSRGMAMWIDGNMITMGNEFMDLCY